MNKLSADDGTVSWGKKGEARRHNGGFVFQRSLGPMASPASCVLLHASPNRCRGLHTFLPSRRDSDRHACLLLFCFPCMEGGRRTVDWHRKRTFARKRSCEPGALPALAELASCGGGTALLLDGRPLSVSREARQ